MLRCTIRRELPSMFPVTRKKKKEKKKKKKTHAKNTQIHRDNLHRERHSTEDIPIYRLQFSGDKVKTKKKKKKRNIKTKYNIKRISNKNRKSND